MRKHEATDIARYAKRIAALLPDNISIEVLNHSVRIYDDRGFGLEPDADITTATPITKMATEIHERVEK